jgi:hypothetical protein
MRILFVATHPFSSGEAMTALHSAAQAERRGAAVRFFASARSAQVLARQFPGRVTAMTTDGPTNRGLIAALVAEFRPQAIVFCDYALLPSSAGSLPLDHDAGGAWIDWLDGLDAELFTFDHMGLEQPGSAGQLAGLRRPARMRVLLPCPMHEPSPLPGRRGVPFRCWTPRRLDEREREAARGPFAPPSSGYLVIHAVSSWAWELARARRSPYYDLLPSVLESYFADFPRPVTIVSINNGSLLRDAPEGKIRIVNLSPLAVDDHERLLASADLVLTENCFSSTLAKAVCFGVPGVAWQNVFDGPTLRDWVWDDAPPALVEILRRAPASIEPWLVFPLIPMDWRQHLRVLEDNSIGRAFLQLEIFGGSATSEELRGLLFESPVRRSMEEDGRRYARSMGHLPDFHDALKEAPSA